MGCRTCGYLRANTACRSRRVRKKVVLRIEVNAVENGSSHQCLRVRDVRRDHVETEFFAILWITEGFVNSRPAADPAEMDTLGQITPLALVAPSRAEYIDIIM